MAQRPTPKPIKLINSSITGAIYATRNYRELLPGQFVCSGTKTDVTREAIAGVLDHASRCDTPGCLCVPIRIMMRA